MPDAPETPQEEQSSKQYELNEQDTRHVGAIPERAADHENVIAPDSNAGKYLPKGDDEGSKGHSYVGKEELSDGTIIYYYGDGVKSIHHPDPQKASRQFHVNAQKVHRNASGKLASVDGGMSRAHESAAQGHDMAAKAKFPTAKGAAPKTDIKRLRRDRAIVEETQRKIGQGTSGADRAYADQSETPRRRRLGGTSEPEKMSKLVKDFADFTKEFADGTVAVASDPGVFTPTYGSGPAKKKSKRSGVEKLDNFLGRGRGKVTKASDASVSTTVANFATSVVKEAGRGLKLLDVRKGDTIKKSNAFVGGFDSSVPMRDTKPNLPKQATPAKAQQPKQEDKLGRPKVIQAQMDESLGIQNEKTEEEDFEKFYEMFKEYFSDEELAEDTNDSRDSKERLDTEKAVRSNVD